MEKIKDLINLALGKKTSLHSFGKSKKVFVGLSGGVDSAVSAALLKSQGYDVTGVFIKVWHPDFLPCNWKEERRDAMRVALALDIPFLFLDFEEEYKKGVADYMITEYKAGRTPNPDVLCNREIKFKAFWKKAKELGADYIATGHYAVNQEARIKKQEDTSIAYSLREGKDKEKDQSYFLWTLTQEDLAHVLFPVGHLEKSEVRKLANKFNLPVASKKDSQGICFLGEISLDEFLGHFITTKPGKVLDTKGNVIGTHRGALYYTMGERRGFDVTKKVTDSAPYYVVSKDMRDNTITVSNEEKEIISHSPIKVAIKSVNWITEPDGPELTARIRYRQKKIPVEISLMDKKIVVTFKEPQRGLSLGQSIVFYSGEQCLGGGVFDRIIN
jgi:tRNA-uridine 2-sulfurtransferase